MKENQLIIENFQKGMAPHPALGFGLFRNIDLLTYPGVARINKATSKVSSTTVTDQIQWMARETLHNIIWALGNTGKVYKSTNNGASWSLVSGNTLTGATGQGMAIWKNYLFVARDTAIDIYGPLDSSPSWTNAWSGLTMTSTIATVDFHPMLASIDDKLYIADGRYVHSIAEATAPFAPGTSNSYTVTSRAITLSVQYEIKCLAELGPNLELGTLFGTGHGLDNKVADIFPYSRSSLTLGIPIRLGENGVHAMLTVGNRIYLIAGNTGKLFVTDGSSSSLIAQLPYYAVNLDAGAHINPYPGAIMHHKGKIFFGVGSDGIPPSGNLGVWSYNIATQQIQLENIISTGSDGSVNELEIASLFSISTEQFLIGWRDNATYGIDLKSTGSFYTTYGGAIETELYQVGESLEAKTGEQLEVYFAKPLISGQGIKVKYRLDLTSSFTTLFTEDFSTLNTNELIAFSRPAGSITRAVFIQFRFELTSTGSDSPELRRVALKFSQ